MLLKYYMRELFSPGKALKARYEDFKVLLVEDDRSLEFIADLQETFYGVRPVDKARVGKLYMGLLDSVGSMTARLEAMRPLRYRVLREKLTEIGRLIKEELKEPELSGEAPYTISLEQAAGNFDLAGGKGANLGRIISETDFNVFSGFVVTTHACNRLISENGLREKIDAELSEALLCRHSELFSRCEQMTDYVMKSEIPHEIMKAVTRGVENLKSIYGENTLFAVRSSAWAEDGEFSFAGQYETFLNVQAEDIPSAYLGVLASKYSPRAVTYRILRGLSDASTPMAVVVMPMVDAQAAGVAYSSDAGGSGRQNISVHSVPGLGEALVDGSRNAGVSIFKRNDSLELIDSYGESGTGAEHLRTVAGTALELEKVFKTPQDVEWAVDKSGNVFVLQSRPFHPEEEGPLEVDLDEEPILSGLAGISTGWGSGRIIRLHDAQDPAEAPRGSVVVFETLAPNLTRCLDRVEAVIGTSGARASHFATVAREYGIPVVVGDGYEISALEDGQLVTVDALNGMIYPGRQESLVVAAEERRRKVREDSLARYNRLIPLITTLNMTDPEADNFTQDACSSIHDIIRFTHEKGVNEMFRIIGDSGRGMSRSRKLKTDLPLTVYVLSLDSDFPGRRKESLSIADVGCRPMQELWSGIEAEETVWDNNMPHMDWERFDQVSAGIFSSESHFLSSYALVASDYVHMMIRFGYHFSIIDSVCGTESKNNYVKFRFKGGGADFDGRLLRLSFIDRVLRAGGFSVTLRSDMLDAELSRQDADKTTRALNLLGRVLARTRMLDMKLSDMGDVDNMADEFIENLYSFKVLKVDGDEDQ
jgi:pyruvate,water dikinase